MKLSASEKEEKYTGHCHNVISVNKTIFVHIAGFHMTSLKFKLLILLIFYCRDV